MINRWLHRLRAHLRPGDVSRERSDEVNFHLSLASMHAEHEGMDPGEARARARREFGNVTTTQEIARGVSRSPFLDATWQDIRYAVRALRRSPGYAIGAALILAIGVGASTTVFSIFDAIVRNAVPYPAAKNLYFAMEERDENTRRGTSYLTFRDWVTDSAAWKGPVDGMAFIRGVANWIDGADGAERAIVGAVTPDFFRTMGMKPMLGRTFTPEEQRHNGDRVVVISHDAWYRYFAGAPDVIGRSVQVDSVPTTIIGVMPKGFVFPQWSGTRAGNTYMWIPIAHIEATDPSLMKRGDRADLRVVVRISADADSARAARALGVVAARVAHAYPAESEGWTSVSLLSVRDGVIGPAQRLLTMLAGAVGLVLLLACANVANLTFVRGASRVRELAVRTALGAGRMRVVRQLLTESVLLAALGCLLGLAFASVALAGVRTYAYEQFSGSENIGVNAASLGFGVAVAMIAALLAAVVPAFRSSRVALAGTIRSGAHSSMGTRRDGMIRSGLVVLQLGLALVLLIGSGLFVRSLRNVAAVDLGFDPENLIATAVTPPAKYATAQDALALYDRVMDRLRAIPGVTEVGFTNHGPLGFGGMPTTVTREGDVRDDNQERGPSPLWRTVSEGYLRAMKMEMASGRWFTPDDMRTREGFVVNEALAQQLFPGTNALGQRVVALRAARPRPDFGQPVHGTIIGVVRDVRANGQDSDSPPEIYVPYTLETWHWGTVVIRTRDVAGTIPLTREALREVDPAIPEARASGAFNGARAMSDRARGTLESRELMLKTVGIFAVAALLLAAIGLYSVVSYSVSQRTREVGVRVALGATNGTIVRLIVGEGTRLAILGVVIGVVAAFYATKLIRTMLFNTPTTDVATYAITAAILLVTAALACYLPARRAARLSPVEAIRGE